MNEIKLWMFDPLIRTKKDHPDLIIATNEGHDFRVIYQNPEIFEFFVVYLSHEPERSIRHRVAGDKSIHLASLVIENNLSHDPHNQVKYGKIRKSRFFSLISEVDSYNTLIWNYHKENKDKLKLWQEIHNVQLAN